MAFAALLVSAALGFAYFDVARGLPRGPSEFVAWPPLEPLPFAAVRGFTYEQLVRYIGRLALLGPALLLTGWALSRLAPERSVRALLRPPGRRTALAVVAVGVALCCWLQLGVFEGRALMDDELTYSMQAQTLASGSILERDVPSWGSELFTLRNASGATGKYLPGEALVQVPGVLLGYPALLHVPLLLLTVVLFWSTLRRQFDGPTANVGALLLALSPMVLLTSALALSQATSMFLLALTAWLWGRRERGHVVALLLGLGLGCGVLTRPQVFGPLAVVLPVLWLLRPLGSPSGAPSRGRWLGPGLVVLGGLPAAALLGFYNDVVTGSALRLPWTLAEPRERWGFGQVLEGDPFVHTLTTAIENLVVTFVRLDAFAFGWPTSLALAVGWLAWHLRKKGVRSLAQGPLGFWLGIGLVQVLAHVPYYSTGVSETGALYHYELILVIATLSAVALVGLWRRAPIWTGVALATQLVFGTGSFLYEQVGRIDRQLEMIHGPAEAALGEIAEPAILFYERAPQESIRLGWVNSGFPKRQRADWHRVLTYPRPAAGQLAALRRHYTDRDCWYYRVDPQRLAPEVLRCEEAAELLARPLVLEGPALAIPSTAMRKGYVEPPGAR